MEKDLKEASGRGDFSRGSVRRHIIRLAVPMTLAQFVNLLYSIVDRIYLGRLEGTGSLALTAVGIVLPVISIIMGVASLCGMGGAPLFSIARGGGDDDEAEKILGNSFALLMIFGVAATLLILIFERPLLYGFGASDATFPLASAYMKIYIAGTLFVMISLGMNPFINAQGAVRRGMMTVAIGAVTNIVLDPIFIFTLDLGISGAALATIIAQFCSAVWALNFLCGKKAVCRLRISRMRLKLSRIKQIITLGLATFVMNITASLIQIVSNRALQQYGGDLYVGIMTIVNSLREIIFAPINGLNSATTPVLGYNYGAGLYDRVKQSIRFSTLITVVYLTSIWAVIMLAPRMMIGIFTGDQVMIETGVRSVRIYFAMGIFMSLQMSAQVVFVALGKSKFAIFFSLLRKVFISIPLIFILPRYIGTDGVFAADTISQVISGSASMLTMYLTQYRRLGTEERLREV